DWMSCLESLNLKNVYRTGKDDLYNDFYKPSLSVATSYDRAVGYFSSSILSMSAKGLSRLIAVNGTMRLIIGHPLSNEEFEAVKHGILLKEHQNNLSQKLEDILCSDELECKRLELLAWLIACGNLEIKFALRRAGMYHEKVGIFRDKTNNIVVFQGSANETPHGMVTSLNAESISVYKSWDDEIFKAYGQEFIDGFDRLWSNQEVETITLDVPSATYEKISTYVSEENIDFSINIDFEDEFESRTKESRSNEPIIPTKLGGNDFNIFKHQRDALSAWKSNCFKGILKLATGSGKTITSIYGAIKIYEALKRKEQKLFIVIAVPYVELALQWVDNLRLFNISAICCFDSRVTWEEQLRNNIDYFEIGVIDFCVVVVVNRTLVSDSFQMQIKRINNNSLMLIGDECHNHGSKNINSVLPDAYYRMGLSATPFRSDDEEIETPFPNDAKTRLVSYYGDIVACYSLADAINDGVLTPYEYHIIPVYLTSEEQEKYEDLSNKIVKLILKQQANGLDKKERENLTKFCGFRSRLLGSAKNKLVKLKELTTNPDEEQKSHTLFYSGEGKPYSEYSEEDEKVIDLVSKVLNGNGWRVSKFTSKLSRKKRKSVMSAFKDKTINGLVAMKVLDEGIDVPACKTAYILASTKNPRQYVQRRGRILRKSENKHLSVIYDFVVLPINDSQASKKLRLSEAERINDFALLATNKIEIERNIEENGLNYDY
ncbi:DEAD/DEAH box helicase family protein, partial [Shewanella sp. Isolate13]|uniref:helicase-related protein n=1 Tax=Shewanella sp. Isolate13 TaxID=2908531 RepID=UPI001EFDDF79